MKPVKECIIFNSKTSINIIYILCSLEISCVCLSLTINKCSLKIKMLHVINCISAIFNQT